MKRLIAAILLAFLPALASAQVVGTLMPAVKFKATDADNFPEGSGKLCVYLAGTSTPTSTWSDVGLTTPNSNPVLMDGAGIPSSGAIYLLPGTSYKFILKDPGADATCNTGATVWSQDNVAAIPATSASVDVTGVAGETMFCVCVAYLSDGSDGRNSGQWYKADTGVALSLSTAAIGFVSGGYVAGSNIIVRLEGQVVGVSAITGSPYYVSTTAGGVPTATAPGLWLRRQVAVANSSNSLIITKFPKSFFPDGSINGPLRGHGEKWQSASIATGVVAIDYSQGSRVILTLSANITSFTVTNLPPAALGVAAELIVNFVADGNARTVTHTINSMAVRWPGASAPTMTSTSGHWDTLIYTTYDAGANWFAKVEAQNR